MVTPLERMGEELPLVGRGPALAAVAGALADRANVLVTGSQGAGLSRMLRESLRLAGPSESLLVRGSAATIEVPFAAVAAVVSPDLGSADPTFRYQRIRRKLLDRVGQGDGVLAVDDAHLLDPGSLALVHELVTTAAVVTIIALHSTNPVPEPLLRLWRDGHARRIDLEPLSEAEVVHLVELALGGQGAAHLHRWAFQRSRGLPSSVIDLLLAARHAGSLDRADGLWRLTKPPPIAPRLVDGVRAQLVDLREEARAGLDVIAVGDAVPLSALASIVDSSVVADLERRGLVTIDPDEPTDRSRVRVSDPVVQEVVRADMPGGVTAAIELRLLHALDAEPVDPDQLLRIATWQLRAGEHHDPGLLLDAASQARHIGQAEVAERLAQAASEAGAGPAADLARARALLALGRHHEASSLLAGLRGDELPRSLGLELLATQVMSLIRARDIPAAEDVLARARGWHTGPEWDRRLDAWRVVLLSYAGRLGEVIALGRPLLENAPPDDPAMFATVPLAGALLHRGRTREALAVVDRKVVGSERGLERDRNLLVIWAAVRVDGAQQWEELEAVATQEHRLALASHDLPRAAAAAVALGGLALQRGRPVTAMRWLREGVASLRTSDPTGQLAVALAKLARAEALCGLDATETRDRAADSPPWIDSFELVRADVCIAAMSGDLDAARALAFDGAAAFPSAPLREAELLHDAVRALADPALVHGRLVQLAAQIDSPLVAAYSDRVAAEVEGDGRAIEQAADRFEALGTMQLAAEVYAVAASRYDAEGEKRAALGAAARCRAVAARCEGGRLFAGPPAIEVPALSAREREVARLVAEGLSNSEIAAAMVVSVRTVESHVYRIMAKLGARHRAEVAALLPDLA